jgi:hypothetical protein
MKILSFILLVLLSANTFTAKVIKIIDGDSITVLTDQNQQVKVRGARIERYVLQLIYLKIFYRVSGF